MRKLIVKMSMSLDGFVTAGSGENDWIAKTGDPESLAWSVSKASEAGMIIMGRTTFEMLSAYWPTAPGPFAPLMNTIPKAVFTKKGYAGIPATADQTPAAASWSNAQIFEGDLAEEIKKLKAGEGKPIVAIGGAGFVQSLIQTGLIDEITLAVHPVVFGSGLSIFSGISKNVYLKLVEVKSFPGGAIAKTYTA